MELMNLLGQGLVLSGCGFVLYMFAKHKLRPLLPFGGSHYQDEEEEKYYYEVDDDGSRRKVLINKKQPGEYARTFRYKEFDINWKEDGTFTVWLMKKIYPGLVEYIDHLHKAFEDLIEQYLGVGGLEITDMKVENKSLQMKVALLDADNKRLERSNYLWKVSYDEVMEYLKGKVKEGVIQQSEIREKEVQVLMAKIDAKTNGADLVEIKDETPQEASQFANKIDGTKSKKHKQLAVVIGVNAFGMTTADCQKRFNLAKEDTVQTYYRNGKNALANGEFDISVGHKEESVIDEEGPVISTRKVIIRESYDEWSVREDVSEMLSLFYNDSERRLVYEWIRDSYLSNALEPKVKPARKIA